MTDATPHPEPPLGKRPPSSPSGAEHRPAEHGTPLRLINGTGSDLHDDAVRHSVDLVYYLAGLADTLTAMQQAQDMSLFTDHDGMPYRSLNQAIRSILDSPAASRTRYSERTGRPLPKLTVASFPNQLAIASLIPTGSVPDPSRPRRGDAAGSTNPPAAAAPPVVEARRHAEPANPLGGSAARPDRRAWEAVRPGVQPPPRTRRGPT
jgi:hypothetical protein